MATRKIHCYVKRLGAGQSAVLPMDNDATREGRAIDAIPGSVRVIHDSIFWCKSWRCKKIRKLLEFRLHPGE